MMIECGKAVNTHGVKGELKVLSLCDEGFFGLVDEVIIKEKTYKVQSFRQNRGSVLLKLEGVNDMTAAEAFKGEPVYAEKEKVRLPENRVFYSDIYGFSVFDERFSRVTGKILSSSEGAKGVLLEIETPSGKMLLPDIPQFVLKKDLEKKTVFIKTIEGFYPDEN